MTDKKVILVVDDDAEVRRIIGEVLQVLGYTYQGAADGFKALELIRKERFDIVLCDIRMPGMDGLQVMAEARENMDRYAFYYLLPVLSRNTYTIR